MLNVQNRLRAKGGLQSLLKYSIKSNLHEDGRVILNYCQINSPKHSRLAQECRGLVLDSNNNWDLVARSFPRFFNLGEAPNEEKRFNWKNFIATEKEDGSLIIVYYWEGEWHINTRGSFGNGLVGESEKTWRDLVLEIKPNLFKELCMAYTYVFELSSKYNQVVRLYDEPQLKLLTKFLNEDELDWTSLDEETVDIVQQHPLYSLNEVEDFVLEREKSWPEWEGLVLRDDKNRRLKLKSRAYVSLHRLISNGSIYSKENVLKIALLGENSEVLSTIDTSKFPRLKEELIAAERQVKLELENLYFLWENNKLRDRKEFALMINRHPLSFLLFQAKDKGVHPKTLIEENAEKIARNNIWK